MAFKDDLETLAELICDQAKGQNTPLQEKIDAFKVLTQYHFAAQKAKVKDDTTDGETFEDFASAVNSEEHQHGNSIRRRPGHA